jgi:hypothetical protein
VAPLPIDPGKPETLSQLAPLVIAPIPIDPPPRFCRLRVFDEAAEELLDAVKASMSVNADNCGGGDVRFSVTVTVCDINEQRPGALQGVTVMLAW